MSRVRLEVMPWLSRYFAAERSGRVVLAREVSDGATVGDLLEEIASQSQELKDLLFDAQTGRVAGHISLILNGRFLELSGGLEAKLKDRDTLRLMAGIGGG